MKKTKKALLTVAILTAAVSLSSCDPSGSEVQDIYGPPVVSETETTVQHETEYDPSTDSVQEVYGPPVTEAEADAPETETVTVQPETEYLPSHDDVQVVYGPPPTE